MKINKVKCYQFKNHFLKSLYAPQSTVYCGWALNSPSVIFALQKSETYSPSLELAHSLVNQLAQFKFVIISVDEKGDIFPAYSSIVARLHYPVGKRVQGLNPKAIVEYSGKLPWGF